MGDARITFDLRRGTILVEGTTDDLTKLFEAARAAAPSLKHINIVTTGDTSTPVSTRVVSPASTTATPPMQVFARRMPLENTAQRIAVLAYYAAAYGPSPAFSVRQMTGWFGACDFKQPGQMAYAMTDAKRKYKYIDSRGRDQWMLAAGGAQFVGDLLTVHNFEVPEGHHDGFGLGFGFGQGAGVGRGAGTGQ